MTFPYSTEEMRLQRQVLSLTERLEAVRAENKWLRAALKPFADEVDILGIHGIAPPPERMLMFASDGGGTFLGIQVRTLYDAHRACQQAAKPGIQSP